jgi:hypothetical protein
MARGRLISRTLGSSRRYAALQKQAGKLGEFAQSLYPMLVTNSDDHGRGAGDPFTVKMAIFPSSPRKEDEFFAALTAMHQVGLIQLYETPKGQVFQIVGFDEHQPGLGRRTESKFDAPPVNFTEAPGNSILTELNLTELKGTEPKRTAPMRRGDDGFEAFWVAYPKKKSRSSAERVWRKAAPSPELCQRILDAIAAQRKSPEWLKDDGQFIPYPATWLNGQRWEDELIVPEPTNGHGLLKGQDEDWCHHQPRCHDRKWHLVTMARERGEV